MKHIENPGRISSYFRKEWLMLLIVTFTGIIYNAGMAAGPYFEGQLAQCLYEITKGTCEKQNMYTLVLTYVLVILLVQAMRAVKRFSVRVFSNNVGRSMRRNLYNSLIHMNRSQLEDEDLGSLMTKAVSDVDACAEGMRKFTTEVFDTGIVMVVYMAMLFHYDWRLTLLACMFTPGAYFIADGLKRTVAGASISCRKSASKLNLKTMDRLSNALTYRIFGREQERNEDYEKCLEDYEKKNIRTNILEGSLAPVYNAISMLGVILILYFGSKNVTGSGWSEWNIASFTTFLACFTKLAVKASKAAKLFNSVQKAKVSWQRIKPLMKKPVEHLPLEYTETCEPVQLKVDIASAGWTSFSLKDIHFSAMPGEIIGVTGVVASGKSTLGKIFTGETPYTGSISFSGEAFETMTSERKTELISCMNHECELMSASIKDNICLGDSADFWKYIRAVCLEDEVLSLPQKEDTVIGNGGMTLSGGQQSRLALARTLCHAKSLVVLDDPFSAVDRQTETHILSNLKALCGTRIVLLISHRLYHFPEFSRIIFIEDNKAVVSDHETLMKQNRTYARLYNNQMNGGHDNED